MSDLLEKYEWIHYPKQWWTWQFCKPRGLTWGAIREIDGGFMAMVKTSTWDVKSGWGNFEEAQAYIEAEVRRILTPKRVKL